MEAVQLTKPSPSSLICSGCFDISQIFSDLRCLRSETSLRYLSDMCSDILSAVAAAVAGLVLT